VQARTQETMETEASVACDIDCERPCLNGKAPDSHVMHVSVGQPLSRPPLFRDEDTVIVRAGKVVLYVVLSPLITLYIVYDNAIPCLRWTGSVLGKGMLKLGEGLSVALHTVHQRIIVPMGNFAIAAAHDYVLIPLQDALRLIVNGMWSGVCVFWRGTCYVASSLQRHVLMPLYHGALAAGKGVWKYVLVPPYKALTAVVRVVVHGMVAVLDYTARGIAIAANSLWQGTCYVANSLWQGTCYVASSLHRFILVPLYHGALAAGTGVWQYVLVPIYKGLSAVARGFWRGLVNVGKGLGQYILMPVYHGAVALSRHLSHGFRTVSTSISTHIFKPVVQATVAFGSAVTAVGKAVCCTIMAAGAAVYTNVLRPVGKAIRDTIATTAFAVGGLVTLVAATLGSAITGAASEVAKMSKAMFGFAKAATEAVREAVKGLLSALGLA